MDADTRDREHAHTEAQDEPDIIIQESCPGRQVFSEKDNPNGWIGTDVTVDVKR